MKYIPFKYQRDASEFIIGHKKSIVMMDTGMGKRSIILSAIKQLLFDSFEDEKILIVTSGCSAENIWPDEIEKWDEFNMLTYSTIIGHRKNKMKAIKRSADLYIADRESLYWIVRNGLFDFSTVVIDGLAGFKNERADAYKSLLNVMPTVKRVIGLTVPPNTDNISELWSLLYLIDGGKRLGKTKCGFYERYYFTTKCKNSYIRELKKGAIKAIYRAISDICTCNICEDTGKGFDYIKRNIYVELSPSEMSKYNWLKQAMNQYFNEENAKVLCSKLLQVCNGAVYDGNMKVHHVHDKKIEALKMLIEAENQRPTLVVYWFGHDRERIKQAFPEARVLEKPDDFREWNMGKIRIGLLNPATGGKDIYLCKSGRSVVWFSLTWSLQLYNQMNKKSIGDNMYKPSVIYHIIARNTLDERIMEMLNMKRSMKDIIAKNI